MMVSAMKSETVIHQKNKAILAKIEVSAGWLQES